MAIDATAPQSRRALLRGVLGGTAAALAASVAGAQRVLAAGSDGLTVTVGGQYPDASTTTKITNATNNFTALWLGNNQDGVGLQADGNTGPGVLGRSSSGSGVAAESDYGKAVQADAPGPSGMGVHARAFSTTGVTYSVLGENWSPTGLAVLGNNYATTGIAQGVQGTSDSPKGYATLGWARHGGTAIIGSSGPTFPTASVPVGTGVFGYSQAGRGGVFQGKTAQVRLVPSTATTHPSHGSAGDLFLDKSRRLWLCKGGTTWKLVA